MSTPPQTSPPTAPPAWTEFAKYAGDQHFYSGCRSTSTAIDSHVDSSVDILFMLHLRIGSVFADPALPDQVTLSMPYPIDFGARAAADRVFNKLCASAQRRILRLPPLGLLLRYFVAPSRAEITFRTTDAAVAAAKLRPLLDKFPGSSLESIHDPRWEEPLLHAQHHSYGSALSDLIAHAPKTPQPERTDHPAVSSTRAFRSWVRQHPPRCLDGLIAEWVTGAVKPRNDIAAAFDLRDSSGSKVCRIHMHTPTSAHPTDAEDPSWAMGPIHLLWRREAQSSPSAPTLLFDSHLHGYHAELGTRTHPRGEGIGPSVACKKCCSGWHQVRVIFDYQAIDDLADEPASFPIQNYFVSITLQATCNVCGRKTRVFEMGSL